MTSEIYLLIIVTALSAIWLIWDLGLKKLFLDWFRERLFELRFQLFSIAVSGELSFDDEAYRAVETLLCGLLRMAHRVTLISVVRTIMEEDEAKKTKEFVDYHQQTEIKIARTPEAIQKQLRTILMETNKLIKIYTAITSLAAVVFIGLQALNVMSRIGVQMSAAVESEAYRAESRRSTTQQTALAYR